MRIYQKSGNCYVNSAFFDHDDDNVIYDNYIVGYVMEKNSVIYE